MKNQVVFICKLLFTNYYIDEQAQFSDSSFVNELLKDLDLDKDDPTVKV